MGTPSDKIIKKLLNNEHFIQWILNPTPQLDQYWKQEAKADKELQANIDILKNILENIKVEEPTLSTEEKDTIWLKIESKIDNQEKKSRRLKRILVTTSSVAATILVLVGSWWFLNSQKANWEEIDYTSYITNDKEIMKSGNINLVLSDEKVIDIEKDSIVIAYDAQGSVNIDSRKIERVKTETPLLNQLIVPYGKSSSLVLSDGTKVWVNSGSKLVYPSVFDKNKREIFLTGEAYIDVARNENAPFIIKTNHLDVNVLGTKLNVSAYNDDALQSVVLVSGSVEIRSKQLKGPFKIQPDQMLAYSTPLNDVSIQVVDVEHHTSWVNGYLLLKSESLDKVLHKLERHYNLRFNYDQNQFGEIRVSGKLDLKVSTQEALEYISITTPIHYRINGDYIDIEIKE